MGFSHSFDAEERDQLLLGAQRYPIGAAMDELLRRYEPLVQRIARSMTSCPFMRDDLANEARIAFTRAVRNHRLDRPGFGSYAEMYMSGAARRHLKSWNVRSSSALPEDHDAPAIEADPGGWGTGDVASAVRRLPAALSELLSRRYVFDEPLARIAASAGTSESAVAQRLRTAERAVQRLLAAA